MIHPEFIMENYFSKMLTEKLRKIYLIKSKNVLLTAAKGGKEKWKKTG
jgi:hypothetical protein